jgi:D-serine dehydratase
LLAQDASNGQFISNLGNKASEMQKITNSVPLPSSFENAIAQLESQHVDGTTKGMPNVSLRLDEIGAQGWNVLREDLPLPVMVLKRDALEHNIALMQEYCNHHGAWLAPHGKTPMSPQIWAMQLRAGAWAISVSTVHQLQVACTFKLERILFANQLVGGYGIQFIAHAMQANPVLELYVVVDSLEGIEQLRRGLESFQLNRPLNVLVEYGMRGGRSGVRSENELVVLAQAVLNAEPILYLAGVEGYEGIAPASTMEERHTVVETYLRDLSGAVRTIRAHTAERPNFIVSAGGSIFFDRVVAHLGKEALPEAQLVLRPGAYVTHDSFYEKHSPLAQGNAAFVGKDFLRAAFEIWCQVLARPEPELAILGMGGRDVPLDLGLPDPHLMKIGKEALQASGEEYRITGLNDQHAYFHVPASSPLAPGDLVACGISHPCTTFDKWRQLFLVEDNYDVVGAIRTFF